MKAKLQHRRVRHFISPVVRKPQRIYVHAYFLTQLSIVVQAVVSFVLSSRSAFVSRLPRPSWKEERESGVLYCVSRHMGQGLLCVKCHNCIFIWNLSFLCSRLRHRYYGYQKLSWDSWEQNYHCQYQECMMMSYLIMSCAYHDIWSFKLLAWRITTSHVTSKVGQNTRRLCCSVSTEVKPQTSCALQRAILFSQVGIRKGRNSKKGGKKGGRKKGRKGWRKKEWKINR